MRASFLAACLISCCFLSPAFGQNAGLPPAIASAGITQSQWDNIVAEVARQARRAGVAEAALLAAAERAGANLARSGQFDAAQLRDAIIERLQRQAQTINDLQERLAILARADDPEIARLLTAARVAINEGRLDDADQLLAQAEESDLAAVAVAEARAERARARIADAIAERGQLEPRHDRITSPYLHETIADYEATLRSIDRTLAPRDWTRTQFNLGIALAILAQNGEEQARVRAIEALGAALSGYTELQDDESGARAERLIAALQRR